MTTNNTYAIGDLQGCYESLVELLAKIDAATPQAKLIFVGDLVNRGPNSLATLRLISSLGDRAQAVLGNHDLHLLAAAHGIRKLHRQDTLAQILDAPDCDELLDWLRQRPLALFENSHLLLHAGALPQWSAARTLALAREVETVLRGPDWVAFLHEMYGNEPTRWDDALQGSARLRCIVNALTRLRFCTEDGAMEFAAKESSGTSFTRLLALVRRTPAPDRKRNRRIRPLVYFGPDVKAKLDWPRYRLRVGRTVDRRAARGPGFISGELSTGTKARVKV